MNYLKLKYISGGGNKVQRCLKCVFCSFNIISFRSDMLNFGGAIPISGLGFVNTRYGDCPNCGERFVIPTSDLDIISSSKYTKLTSNLFTVDGDNVVRLRIKGWVAK